MFQWLKKAAYRGDPEAQTWLSVLYKQGVGIDKNEKLAEEWLNKAAERGYPSAQAQKAHGMVFSIPTKKGEKDKITLDMVKYKPQLAAGVALFEKAAEQEDASAQWSLWFVYSTWTFWDKHDPAKAVGWLKRAAANGNARAQCDLGQMLETGKDWLGQDTKKEYKPPKDPKEAFDWYRKAATQGNKDGFEHFARCLAHGIGVPANPGRAVELYKLLANNGVASSMYQLGSHYEKGLGVAKDQAEALRWYKKGAAAGSKPAQKRLKELGKGL